MPKYPEGVLKMGEGGQSYFFNFGGGDKLGCLFLNQLGFGRFSKEDVSRKGEVALSY